MAEQDSPRPITMAKNPRLVRRVIVDLGALGCGFALLHYVRLDAPYGN